jgi:hypothetical protein
VDSAHEYLRAVSFAGARPELSGHHGEQLPLVCDAFEDVRSLVGEADLRSAHQLLDGRSDKHFTWLGQGGDPCADMYRDAGGLDPSAFDLAGMQAGTDLQADLPDRIADSARAANGACRPVEGRKEAVASGVDLGSGVTFQELANPGVVTVEKLAPTLVSDCLKLLGGTSDVGEQYGDKYAVRGGGKPDSGDEGLDLGEYLTGSWPGEERMSIPRERNDRAPGMREATSRAASTLATGSAVRFITTTGPRTPGRMSRISIE